MLRRDGLGSVRQRVKLQRPGSVSRPLVGQPTSLSSLSQVVFPSPTVCVVFEGHLVRLWLAGAAAMVCCTWHPSDAIGGMFPPPNAPPPPSLPPRIRCVSSVTMAARGDAPFDLQIKLLTIGNSGAPRTPWQA